MQSNANINEKLERSHQKSTYYMYIPITNYDFTSKPEAINPQFVKDSGVLPYKLITNFQLKHQK